MTTLVTIGALSLLTSLALTPAVRRWAIRRGLVDRPDGRRKTHSQTVALGGGVAVLLAVVFSLSVAVLFPNPVRGAIVSHAIPLTGLLLAAVALCLVGLADDAYSLRGRQKLLGQVLAASVLIASGLLIQRIEVFGAHFELGVLAIPFTLFWLLGAINAVNLIDGIDGLATTVGMIMALAIAILSFMTFHVAQAAVAVALFGALSGFLVFNFPPARMFLGDAGSMLIGLIAGALAIQSAVKGPATAALAAPVAVWAIPIFDSAMAIIRRKCTGRSIYATDRGHLHHCLLKLGCSSRKTLYLISTMCALTAAGALASVWLRNELLAVVSILTVLGTLVATGIFGRAEFFLLSSRLRSAGVTFLRPIGRFDRRRGDVRQTRVKLQGSRNWEEIWDRLIESAEILNLSRIELDVNVPLLHEGYHATWRRAEDPPTETCWRAEVPLFVVDRHVGRLFVAAIRENGSLPDRWLSVLELIESIETRVSELVDADVGVDPKPDGLGVRALDLPRATVEPQSIEAALD